MMCYCNFDLFSSQMSSHYSYIRRYLTRCDFKQNAT
ncbi:hypothetical protein DICVIV_12281 [Dictyocaulus viviparus]|uniref:Uncharacterized protein n=1 Tax=Dictyocaulus viviparus TaxID=29172 RepID=A0A0D8XDA5_DICVI|nr:hypothetical protein DICVIV_12281 [Dictyocaulus viviparus]